MAYRAKIEHAAAQQTDEDALQSIDLFPRWKAGKDAAKDVRWSDYDENGELSLYRCIQPHRTQDDWHPKDTPAMWDKVSLDEWPEIPEHIPSTNPWNTGDKGTWKGEHYICRIDGCVWNPDEYPQAWDKQ